VKNQIWSLDMVSRAGGFQPFLVEDASTASSLKSNLTEEPAAWSFELLPETVEKLFEEPGVKARMDLLVQKRVNQALNKILEGFSWAKDHLGAAGLQANSQKESLSELSELTARLENHWKLKFDELEELKMRTESVLDASIFEWKTQKDVLLKNHEKEWLKALSYLIEKLQIKQKSLDFEALSHWLRDAVEEFSAKAPVTVFVSSADFQQLDLARSSENPALWTLQEDKSLNPGQVRVESNNAGIIFDRDKNFQKVLQMLEVG